MDFVLISAVCMSSLAIWVTIRGASVVLAAVRSVAS